MSETQSFNATSITDLLSLENEVFRSYIFYSALLVVKVFLLVPMTVIQRIKYMVSFWNCNFSIDESYCGDYTFVNLLSIHD